jgi:hypothetical protein
MARNKCKELYDKLDKGGWKVEDIAISTITIKDLEFTKPTMNARETLTVESKKVVKESANNFKPGDIVDWFVPEDDEQYGKEFGGEVFHGGEVYKKQGDVYEVSFGEEGLFYPQGKDLEYHSENLVESRIKKCNESKEEVEVEFKKTPDDGTVIAFFPQTMHDGSCNPGNIMSYEHNGQHGEASIDYYKDCTTCLEEDYADLLHELEGIYHDCELVVV